MTTQAQGHRGQAAGTSWNPTQYAKFADQRLRPALDLLNRAPVVAPKTIYDLGCGPGDITRMIAERWPEAQVFGVDNSKEMLQKAAQGDASASSNPAMGAGFEGKNPNTPVTWIEADITTWTPERTYLAGPGIAAGTHTPAPDFIYSNATLQWVAGHDTLFPRLLRTLAPGGVIAIQMPLSWDSPSHRLMRETLANGGPDGSSLGTEQLRQTMGRKWVESAEYYYDLLADECSDLDIWQTEYLQLLEGENPVLEWVKGTGLRPVLNSLGDAERATFLAEYAQRLRVAYPLRANGKTLYPFARLFIVATR